MQFKKSDSSFIFKALGKSARFYALSLTALFLLVHSETAKGCACGCTLFDVGSLIEFPSHPGGMLSLDYNFQDQNRNWSGSSRAPDNNNNDKEIRTNFVTSNLFYQFNQSFAASLDVPFVNRTFKTIGGASGSDPVTVNWSALGDIRLKGLYTGFAKDLSTGISFGLKLPTGDWKFNDIYGTVDRDTEIGSGSVDFLIGAYHHQKLAKGSNWGWFTQIDSDLPAFTQGGYRPGFEIDAAAGIQYNGWSTPKESFKPVLQFKGAERTRDSGPAAADPVASGYQRVLIAPGVEIDLHPLKIYADVELPIYQHVNGNQLMAPALFKVTVGYLF